jgi:CubicO group peptidase (beta-lactamase class C family)
MRVLALGLAAALAAGSALAQDGAAPRPQTSTQPPAQTSTGALNRTGSETERHLAAARAATWGIALCSGLWSGGQTMEMIERDAVPQGGGDPLNVGPGRQTRIDKEARTVSVTYDPAMPPRHVVWRPAMGCVQLPPGAGLEAAKALPQVDASVKLPNLDGEKWPMGEKDATAKLPKAKQDALNKLVDAAFDGTTYGGRTWGVVVVSDGKIVAEKYDMGFGPHVGAQTHSAAKSFASTLVGIAVKKYGLDVKHAPALKEWDRLGDPRRSIQIEHLLQMRSGLYGEGNGSPQADIYSAGETVAGRAVTNILDTMPGTRFLYNPPDTMLLVRAVRQAVNDDKTFWAMPWTELFWKIGMTRTVTSSDWNGDFLMSGQTYSTARDFARFGLFYLADGVWNGERILPEGWAKYVTTPGPVQPAGNGARYGGQFWIYTGIDGLPEAFSPNGGQGQFAMTIPSAKLVVVRRGYDAGQGFRITKFSADVLKALGK